MRQIKLTLFLLAFICAFSTNLLRAQDLIVKTNNDSISCVIKEIGDDEIKYINPAVSESVVFGVDKNNVRLVRLSNGNVLEFSPTLYDEKNYEEDKKNVLKINFLSPLFNSTNISYERSIKPGRSYETTLGLIGVGWDSYGYDEKGVFIKVGYKFIKSPDYYLKGQRFAHVLKGAYFRPELAFTFYSYDDFDYVWGFYSDHSRETVALGSVLLNFGKQWVIENGFVIDCFTGLGYAFGQNKYDHGLHKAFIGGVEEFPLAFTLGLRVGWNL